MSDPLNSLLMEAQPLPYDASKAARAKEIDTWDFSTGQQHFRLRATRVSKGGLFNAYRHSGTIPAIFYLNQIDDNGKVVKNITKITKPLAVVATVAEIITTELEGLKQAPVVMLRVPKSTNLEAVQRLVNRYIKKNSPQFEIPGVIDIEGEKNAYAAIMRKGTDTDVASVFGVKTGDVTIRDLIKGGAGADDAGKKLADKIEDQTKKDQVKPSGTPETEKKLPPELVGKKGLSGLQMDYEEYAMTAIAKSGIGVTRTVAKKQGSKDAYAFIESVLGAIRVGPTEADAIKVLREVYNIGVDVKTLADVLKWAILVSYDIIDGHGVVKKTEPSGTSVLGLAKPKTSVFMRPSIEEAIRTRLQEDPDRSDARTGAAAWKDIGQTEGALILDEIANGWEEMPASEVAAIKSEYLLAAVAQVRASMGTIVKSDARVYAVAVFSFMGYSSAHDHKEVVSGVSLGDLKQKAESMAPSIYANAPSGSKKVIIYLVNNKKTVISSYYEGRGWRDEKGVSPDTTAPVIDKPAAKPFAPKAVEPVQPVAPKVAEPTNKTIYWYGMQYRPLSMGSVPKGWVKFVAPADMAANPEVAKLIADRDPRLTRHGVIGYDRQLTQKEIDGFQLTDLYSNATSGATRRAEKLAGLKDVIEMMKDSYPEDEIFKDLLAIGGELVISSNPFWNEDTDKYETAELSKAFAEAGLPTDPRKALKAILASFGAGQPDQSNAPKAMSPIDKVVNAKDFAAGEGVTHKLNQTRLANAASQITYAVSDVESAIAAYNKVNHFNPTTSSNMVVSKYRGFRDVLIANIKKYSEMTGGTVTEKDFLAYAQSVAKKYDINAVIADYKGMDRIPEKGGVAPKETATVAPKYAPSINDERIAGEVVVFAMNMKNNTNLNGLLDISASGTVVTIAIGDKTSFTMDVAGSSMGAKYKFTMTKKVDGIRSPALKETSEWKDATFNVFTWVLKHEAALRAQAQPVAPVVPTTPVVNTKVKVGDIVAIGSGNSNGGLIKVEVVAVFKYTVGSTIREFFVHDRVNNASEYSITEERTRLSAGKFAKADVKPTESVEEHAKTVVAELIKKFGAKKINDTIDAQISFGRDQDERANEPKSTAAISVFIKSETRLSAEATQIRYLIKKLKEAMEAGDLAAAMSFKERIDHIIGRWMEYIKTTLMGSEMSKIPAMDFLEFFGVPTEEEIRTAIDQAKKVGGIDSLPLEQAMVELANYINERIPTDLSKYVWARASKLIGDWEVELLMVGAGKNASDTDYFNSKWAHFAITSIAHAKKFELVQKHYRNKMRKPSFKDKGSFVKAADDMLAWIVKHKAEFLGSGLITDQSEKMSVGDTLYAMVEKNPATSKLIHQVKALFHNAATSRLDWHNTAKIPGVNQSEIDASRARHQSFLEKLESAYEELLGTARDMGFTKLYRADLVDFLKTSTLLGK